MSKVATPHLPVSAGPSAVSDWVRRWARLLPAASSVLDLACGSGRHLRWLAAQGHRLTGVDRDAQALEPLRSIAEVLVADLEAGPWPLEGRRFAAVLVTNYLWRPLLPVLVDSVDAGGLLIYETFAEGQASVGRPSRSEFVLRPGELLEACRGLRIVAYEDGFLATPDRYVQRIVAARDPAPLARFALAAEAGGAG